MSRSTNLIIWLIGLLGCSVPIVIIFVSHLFPDTGPATGITMMDVARQTYPNILFMVIAVSGIAIAEAIMLFFRMVEVGKARATPALWLLTMVLLIIFSSISYARILGTDFDPARVSGQQLLLAFIGAMIAVAAALALRLYVLKFEGIARDHVHDNAVMSTLEDIYENRDNQIDSYEFSSFPPPTSIKSEGGEETATAPTSLVKPLEGTKAGEPASPSPSAKPVEGRKSVSEIVRIKRKAAGGGKKPKDKTGEQSAKSGTKASSSDTVENKEAPSSTGKSRIARRSTGTRVKKTRSRDTKT